MMKKYKIDYLTQGQKIGGGNLYRRVVMSWRRDSTTPSSKELNNIKE